MTETLVRDALEVYRSRVSILKKGYQQEKYRLDQIGRSFLGCLFTHRVTSVEIATYRDTRLASFNPKTGLPLSPATVRLELSLLSNFFDLCRIEWGYCTGSNPCADVRKPKPAPGRDRRLSSREERQILRYCYSHANTELYSIVVIALATAMRQGEILRLRWENLNLKSRIAHLPETKNGTKRDVPLSPQARDALLRLPVKTSGPVFHYTSNGFKSTWRFMVQRLGIENLHFHDLRHEAVSRLFELGSLDMMEIAAISGHKSLSMLKKYTHLKANRLVRKLDGNRHKGRQVVLNHLIPYPGVVTSLPDERVQVHLPDFEDFSVMVVAETEVEALERAQDALLRRILCLLRDGARVPCPDQYLDPMAGDTVVMVDPLATHGPVPA